MASVPSVARPTRFAQWSAPRCWAGIGWLVLLLAWCLWGAFSDPVPASAAYQGGNDLQLYRRIVERVHAGESYYDAAGAELRERGYPTASLFNWRFPTYAWFLALFPTPEIGRWLLVAISLFTIFMAFRISLADTGPGRALLAVIVLVGVAAWCLDGEAYFSQEIWAGILILLSACALGTEQAILGVAAGLGALFLRELAGPYILLCLALALRGRQRWQAAAWILGLMLYAGLLWYHAGQVHRHLTSADRVGTGWLTWGGAPFVLDTCRMNEWFFKAPPWLLALYLPLALVGLLGWPGETGLLMAACAHAYVLLFSAIGQPFNVYWGLLTAPFLALGLANAPVALRDLIRGVSAGAPG